MSSMPDTQSTIDADDISRFNSQAGQWWDPDGPMKPLHLFTPVRLEYILAAARRTGLTADQPNRLLSSHCSRVPSHRICQELRQRIVPSVGNNQQHFQQQ